MSNRGGHLQYDKRTVLLVLLPNFIFVFGFAFYAAFGWHVGLEDAFLTNPLTGNSANLPIAAEYFAPLAIAGQDEAAMRALLLASVILFFAVCLFIIIYFLSDIARTFPSPGRKFVLLLAVPTFATVLGLFVLDRYIASYAPNWVGVSAFDLLDHNFVFRSSLGPFALNTSDSTSLYDFAERIKEWVSGALAVGLSLLIAGTISCLIKPRSDYSQRSKSLFLRIQQGRLQSYLLLSALILTTGMAYQVAMMHWPIFVLSEQSAIDAYHKHVEAMAIYWGISYSILICSYYLPVLFLMRQDRTSIFRTDNRLDADATSSTWKTTAKALAVLAPSLAGLLPTLIEGISQLTG